MTSLEDVTCSAATLYNGSFFFFFYFLFRARELEP